MNRLHSGWIAAATTLAVIVTAVATAQYQMDPQPGATPCGNFDGDARLRMQIRAELYGNNYANGLSYRQPYQTQLLPSELQLARERSGALPSVIRMQRNAVGPLDSNGGISYIPLQSPLQRALGMQPPQLYNRAYVPDPQALTGAPRIAPGPIPMGTVRYFPGRQPGLPEMAGGGASISPGPFPALQPSAEEAQGIRNYLTTRPARRSATTRTAATTRAATTDPRLRPSPSR
jgi:hypothetical protein